MTNMEQLCKRIRDYNLFGRLKEIEDSSYLNFCKENLKHRIEHKDNILIQNGDNFMVLEYNPLASKLLGKETYYCNDFHCTSMENGNRLLSTLTEIVPTPNLVIFRVSTNNHNSINALSRKGAFLTETQLVYSLRRERMNLDYIDKMRKLYLHRARHPGLEDLPILEKLIEAAFKEYPSRFKVDPLINSNIHIEIYKRWIRDQLGKENVMALLVNDENDRPCAGAFQEILEDPIYRYLNLKVGWFHLYFSDPGCWGKNYYAMITSYGLRLFYEKNTDLILSETHIDTRFPQYVWQKQGFRFVYSYHTFHLHHPA